MVYGSSGLIEPAGAISGTIGYPCGDNFRCPRPNRVVRRGGARGHHTSQQGVGMPYFNSPAAITLASIASFGILLLAMAIAMPN